MMKKIISAGIILSVLFPLTLSAAESKSTFGLGVEGFHDDYREPSLDLKVTTDYGSVTGYYSRRVSSNTFASFDGRISYGTNEYESPSGTLSGVPQWESELRGRFGFSKPLWGGELSPYIGLGWRYFRDEGKGYLSSLGAQAYDRRISQFYIPIGASLAFQTDGGWTVTPQAEADILFYGNVDSRLSNLVGITVTGNANNTQNLGIGGRGELMFGKAFDGYSIQAGPFIRYWYIGKSKDFNYTVNNTSQIVTVYEPENNRTQVGFSAKVLW